MSREMIGLWERIPRPDCLAVLEVFAVQHIGKLLEISHNDDVTSTGKGQYTSGQVHLGCLVHDQVVINMFKVKCAFNGVGRT